MYRFACSYPDVCLDDVLVLDRFPRPSASSVDARDQRDQRRQRGAHDQRGSGGLPRPSELSGLSDLSESSEPSDLFARPLPLASSGRLEVRLAEGAAEVAAALALRHRILAEEVGLVDVNAARRDLDIFDPYCRHLVVRDRHSGRMVATCRLLLPEAARRLGSLYTEGEFELDSLAALRDRLVEVGRLCVVAEHRDGMALFLLWRAICRFTRRLGHRYLIGCCSVPNDADGSLGASLHRQLIRHHAAPALRVRPKRDLRAAQAAGLASGTRPPRPAAEADACTSTSTGTGTGGDKTVPLPTILRGYLLAGARVLGEPFHDARRRYSDLPLLMDIRAMQTRLGRRLNA